MPRFAHNPVSDSWIVEYEGKTATHKKLAAAIMEENLQLAYYTKSCCITGRCSTCKGKCGALSKEFNIKNATNRDAESVAYWQRHMQYAIEPEFGAMTTDDGIMYQARSRANKKDIREDIYYPKNERDAHAFLRSFADQTNGMTGRKRKRLVVFTKDHAYFAVASGYLTGEIVGVIEILGNEQLIANITEEFVHEKTAGTNANTETIDSWAKTIRNEYGRNYSGSAGFRSRGTTDRVVAVDDGEQNSDPVGYSWNKYGYSSHEELIEAVKSGTMIMNENGDLITFDDGDGISYQQRSTDGLSNRAILANVLSEVAQDDKEASMLKLYTDNVQRLDEQALAFAATAVLLIFL